MHDISGIFFLGLSRFWDHVSFGLAPSGLMFQFLESEIVMLKIPILHVATTAMAVALLSATSASALTVRLSDTVSGPITVTDGGADDLDAATVGEVLYDSNLAAATLGGAFSFIEFSATSKPVIGTPNLAELTFEIEANSNFNAETLQIAVTETGFSLGSPNVWNGIHALGGFTSGSVLAEAFWDPGNTAFATTNSIGGPFSFGSTVDPFEGFGTTLFDTEIGNNPFSMTTVFTITHGQGDEVTEFASGAALAPVPVPASLPLLLAALGVGGFIGRRKAKKT